MLELTGSTPALAVQEPEYHRLLGFPPGYEATGRVQELAQWARRWYREHGRPWWYARQAGEIILGDGTVTIDGATFASTKVQTIMGRAGAHSAILMAMSAGSECEQYARTLWDEGKPDEYFFLDVFGSAVVEALVATASYRLCEWADEQGLAVLPHYSPGYPGWDIADQQALHERIVAGTSYTFQDRLRVLPTGMLQPKKSLLAVFGVTANVERVRRLTSLVPCEHCSLPGCGYRRLSYRHPLPQIEGPRPLPPRPANGSLTPNARYSIGPGALEKWSQQRLELRRLPDRSVAARFRYEGTTCSSLGQLLTFDYHLHLSPPEGGYTIIDARCEPAPGSTGYTYMCEYLAEQEQLLETISRERPLLGRPLDEVLTWQPDYDPAGCYCAQTAREHKWGLVLEVLHFALANSARVENAPISETS